MEAGCVLDADSQSTMQMCGIIAYSHLLRVEREPGGALRARILFDAERRRQIARLRLTHVQPAGEPGALRGVELYSMYYHSGFVQ